MRIQVTTIKTIEEAMKKLNRLKVGKMYIKAEIGNHKSEFDATWYRVLHEYCLYEEEYDMSLGKRASISALKWLMATKHLTIAYKTYTPYNYEMIEVVN